MQRRHKKEIRLSDREFREGFAVRSALRCHAFYRIGETRLVKNKNGCTPRSACVAVTIKIIDIIFLASKNNDKAMLIFEAVK